ncbi:hypothetical protein J7643_06380 [bacterium]|nr:hypothetical protein [bacterium]
MSQPIIRPLAVLALLSVLVAACAVEDGPPFGVTAIDHGSPFSGGEAASASVGVPTVRFVTLDPQELDLNAPDPHGETPAGLAATGSLTVEVMLSNGSLDPHGVTWSVSETWLTVDRSGLVRLLPEAAGTGLITATSVTDPTQRASVPVTVTRDGIVRVSSPLPSEDAAGAMVFVQRGNAYVGAFSLVGPSTALRLPAGEEYSFEVSSETFSHLLRVPRLGPNQLVTLDLTP